MAVGGIGVGVVKGITLVLVGVGGSGVCVGRTGVGICVRVGETVGVGVSDACTASGVSVGGCPVRWVKATPPRHPKTRTTASPSAPKMIHWFLDTSASPAARCLG